MPVFQPDNITDAVVDRFGAAPDLRLREIMTSLVRHAHAWVREIEPTMEEWMQAIEFLTRVGQISVGGRQEFILLSDTLGISTLVDGIAHRGNLGATQSTILGPFYRDDQPVLAQGSDIAQASPGMPLYVDVRFSSGGSALAKAIVDVWQSDSEGFYDVQRSELGSRMRGRFETDSDGGLRFWTIMPTAYPIPDDGPVGEMLKATNRHPWRPAHLHFMAVAPGCEPLVTHIFVAGDEYLASDAVFGVKPSLINDFPPGSGPVPPGRQVDGAWRRLNYHFCLAPKR
jgi:hydroxyquinol 1,2-dioxygenase